MTTTYLIYDVHSGPWDDGEYVWNVCKVSKDGDVFHKELYFNSYDDAYELIKHFNKSIEPLELELEDEDDE